MIWLRYSQSHYMLFYFVVIWVKYLQKISYLLMMLDYLLMKLKLDQNVNVHYNHIQFYGSLLVLKKNTYFF